MAALALFDGEAEITGDNIKTLLDSSKNTYAPYWPALFAGFLKNGRIDGLVFTAGGGGGGGSASAAPAAGMNHFKLIYFILLLVVCLLICC